MESFSDNLLLRVFTLWKKTYFSIKLKWIN